MFERITFDPKILGGKACIRRMRIPVSVIVGQIAHGATFDVIKPLAVQSRKRIFDMASQERLTIAGTHLGFPGIGNVTKRGSEYGFIPARWQDL